MTDLTFCYLHMTRNELLTLDTIDTPEYIKGELDDNELEIPPHMVPPNPDDSDSAHVYLPSQVHPSYPYGNPTSIKHPAVKPRIPYDPTSRALFEDMGFAGGGVNGQFRWKELALDQLLPIDEEREEQKRAAQARKMATGTTSHAPTTQQRGQTQAEGDNEDEDDEDEEDEEGEEEDEEEEDSDEDD
ncbi:hypothetical protein EST38_g5401 [Candolleomyces aberdarensis]|uniref:Uncharacterized protein n=1 Tax=Candolleomyces aberdarensis TaxID=2316362 RepID=A0A4Q2DNR1_9AGAR|nr:hypothetical protein EST38_g5401 [Candolleomyces aberdarensis]